MGQRLHAGTRTLQQAGVKQMTRRAEGGGARTEELRNTNYGLKLSCNYRPPSNSGSDRKTLVNLLNIKNNYCRWTYRSI